MTTPSPRTPEGFVFPSSFLLTVTCVEPPADHHWTVDAVASSVNHETRIDVAYLRSKGERVLS